MFKYFMELTDTYNHSVIEEFEINDSSELYDYIIKNYSDSVKNRGWHIVSVMYQDYFDDLDNLNQKDIIDLTNLVNLGNSILKARRTIYKTTPIENVRQNVK